MNRGEIYRTSDRSPERGGKPGYYVIVSRTFIAENDDVETVICAPVYSRTLGISTEVAIGREEGVPRASVCGCEVCRRSVQMCPADASEQVMAYAALWDSINRKRPGCSWDANPCVVAVTFNPEAQTP